MFSTYKRIKKFFSSNKISKIPRIIEDNKISKMPDMFKDPILRAWIKGNYKEFLGKINNLDLSLSQKTLNEQCKEFEQEWGIKMYNKITGNKKNTNQWTNKTGEFIVEKLFETLGCQVTSPKWRQSSTIKLKLCVDGTYVKKSKVQPDLETKQFIIEVKSRNYYTPGTISDKVLGTPYKYRKVPKIYKKPLLIVLVGFQEQDLKELFMEDLDQEGKEMLKEWKKKNIIFVAASELLEKIDKKFNYTEV